MKTIAKYLLIAAFSLAAMLGLNSCVRNCLECFNNQNTLRGNGNIVVKTVDAPDFTAVKADRTVKVKLVDEPQGQITVQADENVMPYVVLTCEKGVLKATIDCNSLNIQNVTVKVTVPANPRIEQLEVSSAGQIRAERLAVAGDLSLKASSAGQIEGVLQSPGLIGMEISSAAKVEAEIEAETVFVGASSAAKAELKGRAAMLRTNLSSSAKLDAEQLLAEKGDIHASSAAKADVRCSKSLYANASSAAGIRNHCRPEHFEISKSSAGSVDAGENLTE